MLRAGSRREKIEYYNRNRAEIIRDLISSLGDPREPAIAGTIVLAPIVVVFFVGNWLLTKLNQLPGAGLLNIFDFWLLNQGFKLGVFLFVFAVVVTGVGRFVGTNTGFRTEKSVDWFFSKLPLLGTIYEITKVTTDTVLNGADEFRRPVKLAFNGVKITAFKTGNLSKDGREIVFMPTSPNITTGLVLEVEENMIEDVDETMNEALTRVLSAGFGDTASLQVSREP